MTDDPLKPLQQVIDREHDEAIRALDTLRHYLTNRGFTLEIRTSSSQPPLNGSSGAQRVKAAKMPRKRKKGGGGASFRSQVEEVAKREYKSIDEIATATGLEKKQIRGVLYSPTLSHLYHRKEAGETMTFKLKSPTAQTE
jgi:hypothetical protein